MKIFSKSAIKGNSLTMIANIILTGEKLNPLSLRLGTKQRCLALSLLYNIILEILAIATKKKKIIQIGKKLLLIADMIVYVENPNKLQNNFQN